MEKVDDEIDLGALARTLWRGRWLIAALMIGFAILGYIYASKVADPVYVSAATVSIEAEQAQVTNLEAVVSGISAEQSSLNTEIYLINSRELLRRVVVAEDLINDPEFNTRLVEKGAIASVVDWITGAPPPRELSQSELVRRAVDRLRSRISVSNPRQSLIFEISVSTGSPEKSTRLANTLAEAYINDQLLVKEGKTADAIAFLKVRTTQLQNELNEAELAARNFASGIELVSAEALIAKNRQLKELRSRLSELDSQVDRRSRIVDAYEGFDISTSTESDVANLENSGLAQLFSTINQNQASRSRFTVMFEAGKTRAQAELRQSEGQKSTLTAAVNALEEEVANESRDLLTLQQLQREAAAAGEIYGYFLTRLKEAEVQQGTQQAEARLLSPAVEPFSPSSPKVPMIIALAGILGAMFGAGIVLFNEMTKSGIRTASDLQKRAGFPVLGQIPMAPIKRRSKLVPFLEGKSNTPFSEAVRNLRTSTLLADPTAEPGVILITSSLPGEGKTTSAIALAQSLAGMGRSVLLMEGDIRKNTLGNYFDGIRTIGSADGSATAFLENKVFVDSLGFDLALGDRPTNNAADFFSSQEFRLAIEAAREAYDHVIIDAPPVLPVTDARIIGQYVDAILFAVAWDQTRTEVLESGLSEMTNSGLKITGLILTKIDGKKAKGYGGAARYGTYYAEYSKPYS